jgi:hypothetical protein
MKPLETGGFLTEKNRLLRYHTNPSSRRRWHASV